jgi:hypothetical protein
MMTTMNPRRMESDWIRFVETLSQFLLAVHHRVLNANSGVPSSCRSCKGQVSGAVTCLKPIVAVRFAVRLFSFPQNSNPERPADRDEVVADYPNESYKGPWIMS